MSTFYWVCACAGAIAVPFIARYFYRRQPAGEFRFTIDLLGATQPVYGTSNAQVRELVIAHLQQPPLMNSLWLIGVDCKRNQMDARKEESAVGKIRLALEGRGVLDPGKYYPPEAVKSAFIEDLIRWMGSTDHVFVGVLTRPLFAIGVAHRDEKGSYFFLVIACLVNRWNWLQRQVIGHEMAHLVQYLTGYIDYLLPAPPTAHKQWARWWIRLRHIEYQTLKYANPLSLLFLWPTFILTAYVWLMLASSLLYLLLSALGLL